MAKSINRAEAIIAEAMRAKGLTYQTIGERVDEAHERLRMTVRCRTGVGRRAIEIRRKVAEALDLVPEDVWDPMYLTETDHRTRVGNVAVKAFSDVSEEEWAAMMPRERARSILAERRMSVMELSQEMGVGHRFVFNTLHRPHAKPEAQERLAAALGCEVDDIWGSADPTEGKALKTLLEDYPESRAFFGFGDMSTKIMSPYELIIGSGRRLKKKKPTRYDILVPRLPRTSSGDQSH